MVFLSWSHLRPTRSTLMIRLSRMRRSDPMVTSCAEVKAWKRQWGDLYKPELVEQTHEDIQGNDSETIGIPYEKLADRLPNSAVRPPMAQSSSARASSVQILQDNVMIVLRVKWTANPAGTATAD